MKSIKEKKKIKIGFLFCHEGCQPDKDRSVVDAEKIIVYTIGCSDYAQAEEAAKELLKKGCLAIDLCGAFGNEGVARISQAVERKISVAPYILIFILYAETKAAMIFSRKISGVLVFREIP